MRFAIAFGCTVLAASLVACSSDDTSTSDAGVGAAGAAGSSAGGSGGEAGESTGAGGSASGAGGSASTDCNTGECLRAYQCVSECGGPVLSSGCCPCSPPLFDNIICQ
jgi:hypothetical protein